MEIRKGTLKDINEIANIFAIARKYMIDHNNKTQWKNGYPNENILISDIKNGTNYVLVENGEIVGTFSFAVDEEPTYNVIKNGCWHFDGIYGVIHRVASKGTVKGVAKMCFEYCLSKTNYIRIDTHADNTAMQAAIEKFGFQRCGNIYIEDGSERIAYDYLKE